MDLQYAARGWAFQVGTAPGSHHHMGGAHMQSLASEHEPSALCAATPPSVVRRVAQSAGHARAIKPTDSGDRRSPLEAEVDRIVQGRQIPRADALAPGLQTGSAKTRPAVAT